MNRTLFLVVASLLLSACTGPLDSQGVDRVRVLAVRSDPANALPGETVTLTALAVSPVENDPDLTVTWYFCQYPSVTECAEKSDLQVVGTGPTYQETVPASALPGDNAIVWLDAVGHGQRERALKAVPVRAQGDPVNQNPLLDRIWWGAPGGAVPPLVPANGSLKLQVGSSRVVNEIYPAAGITSSEPVAVRTYTSGGTLVDRSGSGASGLLRYDAPQTGATGTFGVWIVVSDGRGGVAWVEQWIGVGGGS